MTQATTHAGGVVFRRKDGVVEYLLVSASGTRADWVLPKGHVLEDEDHETAALREVAEEAGVTTKPLGVVAPSVRFAIKGETINVKFYLMEYLGDTQPAEPRRRCWVVFDDAMKRLRYSEAREALKLAEQYRVSLARLR